MQERRPKLLVKLNRRTIPVQHLPSQPKAPFIERQLGDSREKGLSNPVLAEFLEDKQLSQEQRRPALVGRIEIKEGCVPDRRAIPFSNQRPKLWMRAKKVT